jgi:hypothetical protein
MTDVNEFIKAICTELQKAEVKYPIFCNRMTRVSNTLEIIRFALAPARAASDAEREGGYSFEATIHEEILEALEAYELGDYKACLQELAQCGAVILRAMEFVKHKSKSTL